MSNYLLCQADIIGRQPELRINDMPRNQTLLGGSLCIIVYCFFILASLYFGQELIYRVIPTIIESEKKTNNNDILYLSKSQFSFFFSLYNQEIGFFNPKNYLDLNLYMKTINNDQITIKNITLGNCELNDFEIDENDDDSFKVLNLDQFICIKNSDNNFYLEGVIKHNKYSSIELQIKPCSNNNCKNEDDIKKILEISELAIFYFDTSFDFRKFNKFSNNVIRTFYITFNYNISKFIDIRLGLTKVYTDIGYIFERFKKKELHNIKTIERLNFDNNENTFLINITFQLDFLKKNIYRKYYKIQNWVAELGGIIRAMTLIATFINYCNDRASFYELLINKLFDVDDIIKYFQFNDIFINKKSKRRKRDSIVLRNAKKEKDYFEKGESRFLHNISEKKISPHQTSNFAKKSNKNSSGNLVKEDTFGFMTNPVQNNTNIDFKSKKNNYINNNNSNINNNNQINININSNINSNNNNNNISIISSNNDDEREIYIEGLKKNHSIKEHFEKVKSKRFTLSSCEAFKFFIKSEKENPKFNSFIGGRELLRERTDLIYLLKKNLELDRFKNLILRDNQLVLLNSLTKFLLDPERVNLVDFETCSYEKFIDCYDGVSLNSNMIDLKLAKWVETKFKFEQHNPSAL